MVENKTSLEFINELISSGAFICKKCSDILEPPVHLSENLGNICSSCYNCEDESWRDNKPFVPNKVLDDLLEKMVFECPFRAFGCNERITCKEMQNHKLFCKCLPIQCIFMPNCFWEGRREDFVNHLASEHGDRYIPGNVQNKFLHPFTIGSTVGNTKKILKTSSAVFIMTLNITGNILRFAILDIENKSSKFKFSVKFMGESKSFQTPCTVKEYISNFNLFEVEATELNLDMLANAISSKIVTLIIRIKDKDNNTVMEESILRHFECPVCKDLMKPPIFQCNSGHSVCHFCKPKLERCPTCRGTLSTTRNYSLEALTSQIKYPCVYHEHGCEQITSAIYITLHESSCSFRPYPCFFEDCYFNGNYISFKSHVFNEHEVDVCYGHTHNFSLCHDEIVDIKRYVIIFDQRIFKLTFHQILKYTYCGVDVYISKKSSEDVTYIYEVGLVDRREPDKKIIRTDLCLKNVCDEELFRKCCSFSNKIVKSFSQCGVNNFYIKITKKT